MFTRIFVDFSDHP